MIRLVRGRFKEVHPFLYGTFRKTTYWSNHQINCLVFTEHYQSPKTTAKMFENISLTRPKVVTKITGEYMMTSSDQNLWNFPWLKNPIYSVELIFLKLKVQHIYCFCNYLMNSPAHVVETSLIRPALFLLIKTFVPDIKSLQSYYF